jgi:3-oxoacyl-[acyl-carrier-protein] synthase III
VDQGTPAAGVSIGGWGMAVPERTLPNAELAERFGVDGRWIFERTGIHERRVVGRDESSATLAIEAGRQALDCAGLTGRDIAHLLVATGTPEQPCPATSAFVHGALGLGGSAHDLNAACSGTVYGLITAAGLMGLDPRPILLIGVDTYSQHVAPDDRDVAVLTGDGAGALVLLPAATSWLLAWDLGCDGRRVDCLEIPAGGSRLPVSAATVRGGLHYARMRGAEMYVNAIRYGVRSARRVLDAAGVEPADVDHFVPHQANLRIIQSIVEHAGLEETRLVANLDRYGNTAAASIALALADVAEQGRFRPGDLVLLLGVGAGMTWGSALLRWG